MRVGVLVAHAQGASSDEGTAMDTIDVNGGTHDRVTTTVASRDGTQIGVWSGGDGPPLVLVHGTSVDHDNWQALRPHLEPHVTVHAMDRRGRGASGDAPGYELTREFEDVAAVVDAVAQDTGAPVDVLGHSYGGLCAFGAVTHTPNVRRLVLYEGWPSPDQHLRASELEAARKLEPLLTAGRHEQALETFYRDVVQVTEDDLRTIRTLPEWPARVAVAHTIVRELRADPTFDPEQAARVAVPVLLLVGGDTPHPLRHDPETVAAALPDAHIETLPGQQHIAHRYDPGRFAQRVLAFLAAPDGGGHPEALSSTDGRSRR
jgi:pimeloyl-ACP methyl ester carboxylesterase